MLTRPSNSKLVELKRGTRGMPVLLHDMLSLASHHGLECHVIDLFPFKKDGYVDKKGNFVVRIGLDGKFQPADAKENTSSMMFSAHMDTVCDVDGKYLSRKSKVGQYLLTVPESASDKDQGYVYGALRGAPKKGGIPTYESFTLGADDKAGCYIMCKMIEAKMPGLYVFHVGEECGCIGSNFIKDNTPELLKGITHCIAFDRAGYTDVVAHQRCERTASIKCTDEIAKRLNANINSAYQQYKSDIHGVYTDSAVYYKLVPECINISVGYDHQHGDSEVLDYYFLCSHLLPAVLKTDWQTLPADRDPAKTEYESSYNVWRSNNRYGYGSPKVNLLDVTAKTEILRLPDWKVSDGLPCELSYAALVNLIHRSYVDPARNEEIARDIISIMVERDLLKNKVAELLKTSEVNLTAEYIETVKEEEIATVLKPETALKLVPTAENQNCPADLLLKIKAEFKMGLIRDIFEHRRTFRINDPKNLTKFNHIESKFKKIVHNIESDKNRHISKRVDTLFSEFLCKILGILETVNFPMDSDKAKTTYFDMISYARVNNKDPGISYKINAV